MWIHPQKPIFWFLNELGDELKFTCGHSHREQCIGSIHGQIHQFVWSIRPSVRFWCEYALTRGWGGLPLLLVNQGFRTNCFSPSQSLLFGRRSARNRMCTLLWTSSARRARRCVATGVRVRPSRTAGNTCRSVRVCARPTTRRRAARRTTGQW